MRVARFPAGYTPSPRAMTQQYEVGRTLLGRYVVDSLLGAGGMGEVYVVHHAELARKRFAAKTLRADVFGLEDIEARFRREADVLATLEHPGIVSVVDYGMDGKTPVMVMELLNGDTLRDRLNKSGPLSFSESARIVRDVASALAYTHASDPPVVHRDLKPENLFLVAPDDRVKILDFGIAKVIGLKVGLTQASTALGTPNYMAPEQLRDSATVDARADQFALASIAFECVTAQLAFPGDTIGAVVIGVFDGPRPRPSTLRAGVPASVDAVLARGWAVDPARRYADVKAFAEAFARALLDGQPVGPAAGDARTDPATNDEAATKALGKRAPVAQPTAESPPPSMTGAAIPPTRALTPSAAPVDAPRPAQHAEPGAPTSSGRLPIVVGAIVALLAIGGGIAYALRARTAPPPLRPEQVTPPPSRAEPTLPPHPQIAADPVIAGNPRAAGGSGEGVIPGLGPAAPTAPRDTFEVVHDALVDPVRRCITDRRPRARAISVRVTWSGSMGLPQNVTFENASTPASVRACIGTAFAAYGRIPPQSERTVTRSMRFEP